MNDVQSSNQEKKPEVSKRKLAIAISMLVILFAFIGGIVVYKKSEIKIIVDDLQRKQDGTSLEEMSDLSSPVDPNSVTGDKSVQKGQTDEQIFSEVTQQMLECLQIVYDRTQLNDKGAITVEELLRLTQKELGSPKIVERWSLWKLKNNQGRERHVRLEVVESDEGRIGKELHHYGVDSDGQVFPLEIDPQDVLNPSQQVVDQLLAQGQVFLTEKAFAGLFQTGDRIEYVNQNNKLKEIEFLRNDRVFRCESVVIKQSCMCTQ